MLSNALELTYRVEYFRGNSTKFSPPLRKKEQVAPLSAPRIIIRRIYTVFSSNVTFPLG